MKLRYLLPMFLVTCALAQIDIQVGGIGPIRDITRNATWAASGVGGLNNSFIFTPNFTNESICVFIANNDTSTHSGFTIKWFGTGDQNVSTYQGNTGKWNPLGPTNGTAFPQVLASSVTTVSVQSQAVSKVALVISGGGGAGTANLTLVESQTGSGCGNIPVGPIPCPSMGTLNVPVSTTALMVPAVAGQAVYICTLQITAGAAYTASTMSMLAGTGATCGTGTLTSWNLFVSTSTPDYIFMASPTGITTRYSAATADLAGDGLCFQNGATGQTINLSFTYAQF